jgi:hypothetical protein
VKIAIEDIVKMVTMEVVKELSRRGYEVEGLPMSLKNDKVKTSLEIDMSEFKTPILTENSFWNMDKGVTELIVPANTVISYGASREIKLRKITIKYK